MKYILDACALIALFKKEDGAVYVNSLITLADQGDCEAYIHKVNFLEVYYEYVRAEGKAAAYQYYKAFQQHNIKILSSINDNVFHKAGALKAKGRLSLADAVLLAQSKVLGASVVTADHHEFDALEDQEGISFSWIR